LNCLNTLERRFRSRVDTYSVPTAYIRHPTQIPAYAASVSKRDSPGGVQVVTTEGDTVEVPPVPEVEAPEVAESAEFVRPTPLVDSMPDHQFRHVVDVTRDLIDRRFQKVRSLTDVNSDDVNINPFLMLAMAPAYNIFSPFEAAEYVQNSKLPHGDATAFGKFVEDKIFPIFGTKKPPEKNPSTADLWSPIDIEITIAETRYLLTLKAGPWTMNQDHAHNMIAKFPEIHKTSGSQIIIGITYGTAASLNNKPAMVVRGTGDYVHTLVGKELWEFITGVKDAHKWVFKAIRQAQTEFAEAHGGKTFYEHVIEARLQLSESFRNAFNLIGAEDDMWERIFNGSF
jgi:hypothetical protein